MPGAAAERGPRRAWLLAAAALAALAGASAGQAQPSALLDAEGRIGSGWRLAGLPQQTLPLTRFTAQRVDGRAALRIDADASYGNLVHDLPGQPAPRTLRWSWRLDQPNAAVDLARKSGDDAAAKVCLAFDMALDRVPFIERQLLRLARSQTGQALPAATLCWVWGHAEAHGALLANAYSARVRYLVLRQRADALGVWFDERRDVAADFRRAFGAESPELPALLALIVGADADNSGQSSSALLSGLAFEP